MRRVALFGLIAMALAATLPDRLSAVILNDVGPHVSAEGIARILDYLGRPPDWATHAEAALGLQAALGADFPDVPPEVWQTQAQTQFQATETGLALRYDAALKTALLEQAAAGPPPDLWPLFEALKPLPTGVIRGANSDILQADTLAEMQTRHPAMRAVEIPNRGHVPFLNEPGAVALIHDILDRIA